MSYIADLGPIFGTRKEDALDRYGMTTVLLVDPAWRTMMRDGQEVPTRDFARSLIADGFAGLLIRNFGIGASASDSNIVLWNWTGGGCILAVEKDEDQFVTDVSHWANQVRGPVIRGVESICRAPLLQHLHQNTAARPECSFDSLIDDGN